MHLFIILKFQEISFKKNKLITSLSIPYFIDIFQHNQSLVRLDLSNCELTQEGNQHLKGFKWK